MNSLDTMYIKQHNLYTDERTLGKLLRKPSKLIVPHTQLFLPLLN